MPPKRVRAGANDPLASWSYSSLLFCRPTHQAIAYGAHRLPSDSLRGGQSRHCGGRLGFCYGRVLIDFDSWKTVLVVWWKFGCLKMTAVLGRCQWVLC